MDDPYAKGPAGRPPLKVGQFVAARIQGRTLEQVFVIPRAALQAGSRVHVLDAEDRVRAREVRVVHSDGEHAVIDQGLANGERLVTTPIGPGMEGVQVRVPAPGGGKQRAGPQAAADGAPNRAARQPDVLGAGPGRHETSARVNASSSKPQAAPAPQPAGIRLRPDSGLKS